MYFEILFGKSFTEYFEECLINKSKDLSLIIWILLFAILKVICDSYTVKLFSEELFDIKLVRFIS